jgi:hypothetical protein
MLQSMHLFNGILTVRLCNVYLFYIMEDSTLKLLQAVHLSKIW